MPIAPLPRTVVLLLGALLALALPVPASAQGQGPAALRAARGSIGRGDMDRALVHIERALCAPAVRSEAALMLTEVGRDTGNPELVVRGAQLWLRESISPEGRLAVQPPKGAFLLPGPEETDALKVILPLETARVRAVSALVGLSKKREDKGSKDPAQLLTAAWLRRAGLDLAQSLPRVERSAGPRLVPEVHAPNAAHTAVLKALERVGSKALSNGDPGLAIRAGRIIHGLAVQADFKDLKGQRPGGLAKWRARGSKLMNQGREALGTEEERPWTVEELEWLATDEGEAFTRARSSFATPGVAISPKGLYRIETSCGYETLLAAARTVELHHARLVSEFGSDPFVGPGGKIVQGLVRIVPDPSGLEAEGAPFFWAAGFQTGDTTVLRQSVGTVEGLGRGLTHELTHRFDGALHRGIPAWLAEGRAVWTGAAYGTDEDTTFTQDFVAVASMHTVLSYGYQRPDRLREMISGEPSDYRQNYPGGNALYSFLKTWFPGDATALGASQPVFAARLVEFEDRGKHPRPGAALFDEFVDTFCDGEGGRPASFEELAEQFQAFVLSFDPLRPGPAAQRYRTSFGRRTGRTWIYDEPTWTWDWQRAEPSFGENQARLAGELLEVHGRSDDAIRALVWARAVDLADVRTALALERLLASRAKKSPMAREALFVVRAERAGLPFGLVGGASQLDLDQPMPLEIGAVDAVVDAGLASAAALGLAGAPQAAARQLRDVRRLLRFFGRGLDAEWNPDGTPADSVADAEAQGLAGLELGDWIEESLTRVDDRRTPGLYLVEKDGGLLVGRNQPRDASGRFDRGGGGRAFVRASRWLLPGTYRIKTKVRFTTGYNSCQIVLGWQARGRNIRFSLTAGDHLYAIGEEDKEPEFDKVRWRFDGLRNRDSALPGSLRGGVVDLGTSTTAVDVELVVDGPRVSAWVSGEYAGSYHTIDALPIEGYMGFATTRGAIRVEPTIVRREDGDEAGWLDFDGGFGPPFQSLRNVSVRLPAGFELPAGGAVVLWIPAHAKADPRKGRQSGDEANAERAKRAARALMKELQRSDVVQPLVIAIPSRLEESLPEQELLKGLDRFLPEGAAPPQMVTHFVDAGEISEIDDGRRWVLFVDPFGIARATAPYSGGRAAGAGTLDHWLTVFRDHGQPSARKLPEVKRADPEPESDQEEEG